MSRKVLFGKLFCLGLFSTLVLVFFGLKISMAKTSNSSKPVYEREDLFRLGPQRTFEGPYLREIAFPLGGIGTGTISLGGRGNLRDWEIFNRPGKGVNLPFTFFALYFEQEGKPSVVRVLEGPLSPPFGAGHGFRRGEVPGLPRLERARFRAEYPFAEVELEDSQLPLQITLEAFNPFIPLKPEESGIPAFIFRFRIKNLSPHQAKITVNGSLLNPLGFEGEGEINSVDNEKFGQNINQMRKTSNLSGLFMSSEKVKPDSAAFGSLALATPWKEITYLSHWERGGWWDDLQIFWDDFSSDGRLKDVEEASPSPEGRTDIGSLGLLATIEPSQEVTLPFILSWNFPNFLNYFDVVREKRGGLFKNHYAQRFSDAWDVAEHLMANLDQLEAESQLFRSSFFSSSLPPYVLDAISSQASIIRTPTCFWLEGGKFFGFEGCHERSGCCPLNCSHVWNYEQSLAFLFPSLERFMRQVDFLHNLKPSGEMVFRTSLPLEGLLWEFKPAADGQLGRIINLFRDWQVSGDEECLRRLWPQAKKALQYAWVTWDPDRDGIIDGEQHNTYDIEFFGPTSMIGTFYLGALLAGSKMAEAVDDKESAKIFREIFEKGRQKFDNLLWNGEYYVQKYDQVMEKKYQYGEGCLSDQLLGQWLAMVAGLGRFLPEEKVKKSLLSIFGYNFLTDFRNFSNVQRTYALGDEKGLLLCSWPKGGRPPLPFVYSDEVWTGIEYQVASHLVYENLIEEGLSIVRAVRERYDGQKRNPWDEVECGHHYARAMSSWALLLALSGFSYSAPQARLGFEPKIYPEDFRTFFTTGTGWGSYFQKVEAKDKAKFGLEVASGKLELREFFFSLPPSLERKKILSLKGSWAGKSFKHSFRVEGKKISVKWRKPFLISEGEDLIFELKF